MTDNDADSKQDTQEKSGLGFGTKIRLAGIVVGAIVLLIIVLQNTEVVETKLLFVTLSMPRAVLLFSTTAIGFVLGLLTRFSRKKR
ncbi:MAG: LapA family protein [Planctomycetota bacterium]